MSMNTPGQSQDQSAAQSGVRSQLVSEIDASGYPLSAKQALKLAVLLEIGSLDVTMPDGRVFVFPGSEPGPNAKMIVRDLAFAAKMAKGDIGVAESYLAATGKARTWRNSSNCSAPTSM